MNLLIGIAEDQDRLEKYFDKRILSELMELCQPKMAYSVVNKNGRRVNCQVFVPLQSDLILEPDQLLK